MSRQQGQLHHAQARSGKCDVLDRCALWQPSAGVCCVGQHRFLDPVQLVQLDCSLQQLMAAPLQLGLILHLSLLAVAASWHLRFVHLGFGWVWQCVVSAGRRAFPVHLRLPLTGPAELQGGPFWYAALLVR